MGIKRILFYCSIIIGLCVIFVANITHVIDGIEADAEEQEFLINQFVSRINNVSDALTIYAEDYFENGASYDSEYIEYFVYDEELEMYILEYSDSVPYDGVSLTGLKEIPADGIARQEVNMALSMGRLSSLYYETVPGISWISYVSTSGFMSLYPWVSPEEFVYTLENANEYYTQVIESMPDGDEIWGPIYEDGAGKGYLFPLCQPVYYNDDLLGITLVAFSNEIFDSYITTDYDCYIVNEFDQIIGSNDEGVPDGIVTVNDYFGVPYKEIVAEIKGDSGVVAASGQYVYTLDVNMDDYFCGLIVVPISQILAESLSRTLVFALLALIIVLIFRSFENRRKRLEELARMAITDPLTGVYNRRKFEEAMYERIENGNFNEFHIAVLDLDHFKSINDNLGHDAGDAVLKTFTELLQRNLDEYVDDRMIYARIGGEEFGMIFKDLADKEVINICEALRADVEAHDFGIGINVTVSIGATKVTCEDSLNQSFKNADDKLYEAKRAGRNRVVYDM